MTLSPPSFRKRYRSSYETPSSSSPVSSPTLPSRKRYRGTYELIAYTMYENEELEAKGLGYGAARRHALELAEGTMPSTYEVRQSSRSTPDEQIVYDTPTPRLHVHTTLEDPKDGTIYMDIECDMPLVRPPIQTLPSPV
ncbi:hypothetical protein Tco_1093733 [Tanacetum coccineum]|uniref:Uncharacterized protein n=1 Tax=Tanacetum coccineum TaxID=301880 RepID=A0ABQ5IE12_9ASTR